MRYYYYITIQYTIQYKFENKKEMYNIIFFY